MSRLQLEQPLSRLPLQRTKRHALVSKELDLVLLAGCSCLMTLLHHPIAEALQSVPATESSTRTEVVAQFNQASEGMTLSLSLPSKRDEIEDEEE